MEQELFNDLTRSLKEAKAIARGEILPARKTIIDSPDVKVLRDRLGLSQGEFAHLIRVSVRTLQNWEQRRRNPTGPSAALLKMVSAAPGLALKALHP